MNEWQKVKVGEIAQTVAMGPFGSNIKVSCFVPDGVPVISGQHLHNFSLEDKDFNFVTMEKADQLKNSNAYRGDIIFTHAGNIGNVSVIPNNSWYTRYIMSQRQFKLTVKRDIADSRFLTWFFRSPIGQHLLLANASQTGVPSIARPVTYLRSIEVPLPPLPEQRAIARVLGALDDKIELNRRMNQTLEAIARALFQSWFVDFDPVRAKAEGRTPDDMDAETAALFPAAFEETAAGRIPAGWVMANLDTALEFMLGGDWGKDEYSDDFGEAAYCIRGADMPDLQNAGFGKMPLRFLKASSLSKRRLRSGDLVVEVSGGSPTQSTGRPVLITAEILKRFSHPLVCSNFCRMVRPKDTKYSLYLYLLLRHLYDADTFLQYENGTTGIKNFAFTTFSQTFSILLPPSTTVHAFHSNLQDIYSLRQANALQNDTLATLRDALLPRLLSGEMRADVRDEEREAWE